MDLTIIFFFAAIIIVGGLLFAVMSMNKKGARRLDVDKYRTKWLKIEHQLKRDETSSYSMVVIHADKLLDQALIERGLKGNTMAERMKQCAQLFSDRNGVWQAHKLRNRIAHEDDVIVTYDDARRALATMKRALKDVGAI